MLLIENFSDAISRSLKFASIIETEVVKVIIFDIKMCELEKI